MTEEEILAALLPCQQLVIAKASLAGYTFERHDDVRRIDQGYHHGRWHKGQTITTSYYTARGPGGELLERFDFGDIYEAACYIVAWLEDHHATTEVTGFKLEEGNEQ